MEGVCMLDTNDESGDYLVAVTLKGTITVYKIKNPDQPSIDTCVLEWQASIGDILKARTHATHLIDPTAHPIYLSKEGLNWF